MPSLLLCFVFTSTVSAFYFYICAILHSLFEEEISSIRIMAVVELPAPRGEFTKTEEVQAVSPVLPHFKNL